jgi:hypothetical protein
VNSEQTLEILLVASERDITVMGEQRDVGINDIVEPCASTELPSRP